MGSAAAPGVHIMEEDCCLPSCRKVMPPCSSLDAPPGSGLLPRKKLKHDVAPATLCRCSPNQVEDAESEDEADQRPGSLSMAIYERLSTLQHLLPQGLELEEEDVLKVAIEYVKDLERQIQMFHTTTEGCAKLEQNLSDSPLQRRGLCIVPLSTLAKAL